MTIGRAAPGAHAERATLIAQLLAPCALVVVDPLPERRELALRVGATAVNDPATEDMAAMVPELTGRGPDGVVEAAGGPTPTVQATQLVRIGGTVAIVGVPPGPVEVPIADLLMRNITLRQRLGHLGDMPRLVDLIRAGLLDATPLITHRYSSGDLDAAFHVFERQEDGIIKSAISMVGDR